MISFDVKNLFINVSLDKTIEIILRKIYQKQNITYKHLTKGSGKPTLLMHKTCSFQHGRRVHKLTEYQWGHL